MKIKLLRALLLVAVICTMNSCSSDASDSTSVDTTSQKVVNYTYNASEIETMDLINAYRVSIGLNALEKINHMSYKSEEHDNYMIANNVVGKTGQIDHPIPVQIDHQFRSKLTTTFQSKLTT